MAKRGWKQRGEERVSASKRPSLHHTSPHIPKDTVQLLVCHIHRSVIQLSRLEGRMDVRRSSNFKGGLRVLRALRLENRLKQPGKQGADLYNI
jgi:hypothetical protein